jgi:hypothetical protein
MSIGGNGQQWQLAAAATDSSGEGHWWQRASMAMVTGNIADEGVVLKGRRRLDGLTAQQGKEGIGQRGSLTGGGGVWTA